MGPENIPAKTAIHANCAAMIAVECAAALSIKKSATMTTKNETIPKENTMNRISCYFEKISDFGVGLFLLFLGLILTVISFTIIPVIGLVLAIPVLVLAVSFLGAKKSKECALVTRKARKLFSS
jgi:hypothetical protein